MSQVLTLFTDVPELATAADAAGVDHIGLDLDFIDKEKRQEHLVGNRVNRHWPVQVFAIRDRLSRAKLFRRTNPIHPGSRYEIEGILGLGAEVLMLPMRLILPGWLCNGGSSMSLIPDSDAWIS